MGQQIPTYTTYTYNLLTNNPAFAGYGQGIDVFVDATNSIPHAEGAPQTGYLSASGPLLSERIGIGGMIQYDEIGVSSTLDVSAFYAYKIISKNKNSYTSWGFFPNVVSFGLQAGFSTVREDLTSLGVTEDPNFQSDINETIPTFGAGILVSRNRFYVGMSAPRLLRSFTSSNNLELPVHGFAQAGYIFTISRNILLKPGMLIKYVDGAPFQVDANFILQHHKGVDLGLGYRSVGGINVLVGLKLNEKIKFVYHYDTALDGNDSIIGDMHGVMIKVTFKPIVKQ